MPSTSSATAPSTGGADTSSAFAAAFEGGPLPALITVAEGGRILEVNAAFCARFRIVRDDAIGRTTVELGLWVDVGDRTRLMGEVLARGRVHDFEASLRAADGDVGTFVFSSSLVLVGGLSCVVSTLTDVTERRAVERAARLREERLLRQNDTLSRLTRREAEFFRDLRGALRVITEEAAGTLEVDRASVWLYSEERDRIVCLDAYERRTGAHLDGSSLAATSCPAYFAALAGGAPIDAAEALTDPRTAELEAYLRPLGIGAMLDVPIFVGGRVAGVVCMEHVGSARPWMVDEQSFATALGSLVSLVTEVAERHRLATQLRHAQRMEAIGCLAGGIAHDFNNLLTVINGYSGLVLDDLRADDPLHAEISAIRDAGSRAATLTRQLLAFSSKQILEPKIIDLNDVVSTMSRMLERIIGEDVALELDLQHNVSPIHADAGQIEQVIVNLAVNARDAMADGGRVSVQTRELTGAAAVARDLDGARRGVLRLGTLEARGRYVVLAVRDTGCGMTPEVRDRIFEPFFTTKDMASGTGLGLSTVYGIVTQSGGAIAVDSAPGRGTTFEIFLPASELPCAAVGRSVLLAQGGLEKVLVVEDDPVVRKLAAEVLRRSGYEVRSAGAVAEALALLETWPADVVLTDLVMPGLPGTALAERLRARGAETRVIFMSGYTEDDVLRRGISEDGVAFVHKPFTRHALLGKVRDVLDGPPRRCDA